MPKPEPVSDEELNRQIGGILSMSADMDGDVILRCLQELQQRRRPSPEPTQEEVERVAEALWLESYPSRDVPAWSRLAKGTQRIWCKRARAALSAMGRGKGR